MCVESFSIKRGRFRKEIAGFAKLPLNLIVASRSSRGFRTTPANWFVFFFSCAPGGSRTEPGAHTYAQQLNAASSPSEIFVLDRTLISRSVELRRCLFPAFELLVPVRDLVSRQHGNSSRRRLSVFYLRPQLPRSFREKFPPRTDGIGPRKSLFIRDIIEP